MIEALLYFSLGYFFARAIQPQLRADILLYWNKDCMGWRPLCDRSEMNSEMRYLAAFEVEPAQILESDTPKWLLIYVKVGELVIVRLEETGKSRFLLPGVVINKFIGPDNPKNRVTYEVLRSGETVIVTESDLGPIDMFVDKEQLEKKWNDGWVQSSYN